MFEINSKFKSEISSKSFNDKIDNLVGGNMIVNGFDVTKQGTTSINVPKGTCVIGGAFITETTTSQVINIPSSLTSKAKIHLVIKYQHESQSVEYAVVETIPSNAVIVATIDMASGAISNITLPEKMKKLNELNKVLNEVDTTFEEIKGNYVTVKNSKPGFITELEFLGNTVQNPSDLSDIKSCGNDNGDGTFSFSAVSCGKNLIDGKLELGYYANGIPAIGSNARGVNFIKVSHSVNYSYKILNVSTNIWTVQYDKNFKFIKNSFGDFVADTACKYIRFYTEKSFTSEEIKSINIQLEEGTVATPYTPYQASNANITLPCQLEKVGDVADKLYYDKTESAWCVEKNIVKTVLNGTENNWVKSTNATNNTTLFAIPSFGGLIIDEQKSVICDKYSNKVIYLSDEEGVYISKGGNLYLRTLNSKASSVEQLKKYLKVDSIMVKYLTKTPAKIVLPLNMQAQLNSFLDVTHVYTADTEIEPTIKGKVPKSLDATVNTHTAQINTLTDRVKNVESLKEGLDTEHVTESGAVVIGNTNDVYVDVKKFEGRTLMNRFDEKKWSYVDTYNGKKVLKFSGYVMPSTGRPNPDTCLVLMNNPKEGLYTLKGNFEKTTYWTMIKARYSDNRVETLLDTSPSFNSTLGCFEIKPNCTHLYIDTGSATEYGYCEEKTLVLLEGDHTANPPEYFEGLMSVGDDVGEMEVLSNDINKVAYEVGTLDVSNGELVSTTTRLRTAEYIPTCDNSTSLSNNIFNKSEYIYVGYDENFRFVENSGSIWLLDNYTFVRKVKYYKFVARGIGGTSLTSSSISSFADAYFITKQDNKPLLYQDPTTQAWLPIPALHEWDEVKNGKWYKRSGKVVLNGSENGVVQVDNTSISSEILRFSLSSSISESSRINVINNRFELLQYSSTSQLTKECLFVHSSLARLDICINKSKLSTPDVAGFKKWLSENNVTVVYQLAQEETYECNDLRLDSYDGETMVTIDSGIINGKLTLTTNSNIGNIVSDVKEQVKKNTEDLDELLRDRAIKVHTEKGCEVVENTQAGVISDFKVKGKSLVNLTARANFTVSATYPRMRIKNGMIKPNTAYTYKITGDLTNLKSIYCGNNADTQVLIPRTHDKFEGVIMSSSITFTDDVDFICYNNGTAFTEDQISTWKLTMIEGDHTDNPPEYFEGLLSLGQDADEIEVMSRKEDGNLFDRELREGKYENGIFAGTSMITANKNAVVVSPNTNYIFNSSIISKDHYARVSYYNASMEFLHSYLLQNTNVFTTPVNCKYTNFHIGTTTYSESAVICINKGTQPAPYQPYKATVQPLRYHANNDILAIPALRAAGNAYDTVEKHDDGKYYYHKRCDEVVFDGSEEWQNSGGQNGLSIFTVVHSQSAPLLSVVCDRFKSNTSDQTEGIRKGNAGFAITIVTSRLESSTSNSFKKWLSENNTTVVYQLAQEEVYECTDLNLESYDGETLVALESGAMSGEFSCSINSDLGTVIKDIKDSTKKNTEDLDDLLRDRMLSVESDAGYAVVDDTEDGFVEDLVIKGKTLVNKVDNLTTDRLGRGYSYDNSNKTIKSPANGQDNNSWNNINSIFDIIPDKEYTLSLNCLTDKTVIQTRSTDDVDDVRIEGVAPGIVLVKFTSKGSKFKLKIYDTSRSVQKSISHLMLLEGDHTQNPPAYFEGIAGVGDGVDEIEVVSNNNGDMLDVSDIVKGKYLTSAGGIMADEVNSFYTNYYVNVNKFMHIKSSERTTFCYYDAEKKFISGEEISTNVKATIPVNARYMRFSCYNRLAIIESITVKCFEDTYSHYKYKQDNKPLLYKDPTTQAWLPIPALHEWDEVKNGKWYKRSGKVVLNGSEGGWKLYTTSAGASVNTICFEFDKSDKLNQPNGKSLNIISDKFITINADDSYTLDVEGVTDRLNLIRIKINRNKLETQDAAGFKKWLQANNVTTVYQLAADEVYDIAPIGLSSYANKTMVSCSSGPVSPIISFNIYSDYKRTIQILKNQIKSLEDEVFTADRLSLRSMYGGDSATFGLEIMGVSTLSSSGVDTDAYELIKKNISYGKYCYDRKFMEEIIDFYFMNFNITFDMYIELIDMIEKQHEVIEAPAE